MQMPRCSSRRLIGVAVLACAAALAPIAALVGASPTPAGGRARLHDLRARHLDEHRGQRHGRERLLQPRVHQSLRSHVHAVRLPRGLGGQPRRSSARQRRALQQLRKRRLSSRSPTATPRRRSCRSSTSASSRLPGATGARRRAARLPTGSDTSKVVPFPFLACSRSGPVYLIVQPVEKGVFGWS